MHLLQQQLSFCIPQISKYPEFTALLGGLAGRNVPEDC